MIPVDYTFFLRTPEFQNMPVFVSCFKISIALLATRDYPLQDFLESEASESIPVCPLSTEQ